MFMTLSTPNTGTDVMYCRAPMTQDPKAPCVEGNPGSASARSRHGGGGVMALFCDGSVHWVANSISLANWQALGTMTGGEAVSFEP